MGIPLLCALLYLLLSTGVLVDTKILANRTGIHISAVCTAWGLRLCMIGTKAYGFDRGMAKKQADTAKCMKPLLQAALRALRWGQADVQVHIGLDGAAQTAMCAGAVYGGLSALMTSLGLGRVGRVRVVPAFGGRKLEGAARCIFSFALGEIIFAVALAAVKKTRKEGLKWLSIPLRA